MHAAKPTDEGAVYSVSINPPAPKKGDEVTVEASFMLSMLTSCMLNWCEPIPITLTHCSLQLVNTDPVCVFPAEENVTSGKVQVSATLDNVPLYSGSFDLCDIVGYVGLSCPISAGMHSVKAGPIQIPDIAPSVSAVCLCVCVH